MDKWGASQSLETRGSCPVCNRTRTSKVNTQCDALLNYLKERGEITPLEALADLGIYRLASRILDLRSRGHDIKTTMVGSGRLKYARYSL